MSNETTPSFLDALLRIRTHVRLSIIEHAQRFETSGHAALAVDDLNDAAKMKDIARGLRMAAQIVHEWRPPNGI